MVRLVRWLVFPALLGLLVAAPVLAQNRSEYVQDEAAFFSREAKTKANAEIARIYSQFKRELVIDTVFSIKIPDDIDQKNEAKLKRYLDDWAEKRPGREKVNGIFVLILGEPRTIRVEIGNRTKQSGLFSEADRQELRNQLIANMRERQKDPADQKKKDHVLLAATAFVHDRMSQHSQAERRQQAPAGQAVPQGQAHETPWLTYILIGIGILVLFWIIRGVLRGLSGAMGGGGPRMAGGGYGGGGSGGGGGGYGGGGGGGGFMSSMLGGMFGAAAGMWMYNNVFGGHSNSAWGAGPTGGNNPAAGNDADTSYTGDGGDYGDKGGNGGDQAGTDAGGGGDWGGGGGGDTGGDAGGGGDFGGGGGGDFGGGGGGDFGGGGGGGGDW